MLPLGGALLAQSRIRLGRLKTFTSTMLARRFRCEQQDVIVAVTSVRKIGLQHGETGAAQKTRGTCRLGGSQQSVEPPL